jgi:hypothetical protein
MTKRTVQIKDLTDLSPYPDDWVCTLCERRVRDEQATGHTCKEIDVIRVLLFKAPKGDVIYCNYTPFGTMESEQAFINRITDPLAMTCPACKATHGKPCRNLQKGVDRPVKYPHTARGLAWLDLRGYDYGVPGMRAAYKKRFTRITREKLAELQQETPQ